MELERKAEDIIDEIDSNPTLREFNSKLQIELYDIYRDEFKLKLLNIVSTKLQKKLNKHQSDGSCKRTYPNGECPDERTINDAFEYLEQEYDKIVNDINIYGTLNRYNAHVFGDQFTIEQKNEILSGIDCLISGQINLAEGQKELYEILENLVMDMKTGFLELKELIHVLNKKSWTDNLKGQVWSSIIGLGISTDNAQSLLESIEKSIGVFQ